MKITLHSYQVTQYGRTRFELLHAGGSVEIHHKTGPWDFYFLDSLYPGKDNSYRCGSWELTDEQVREVVDNTGWVSLYKADDVLERLFEGKECASYNRRK